MEIDDGGPAYPQEAEGKDCVTHRPFLYRKPGMTLRDWFAGQALALPIEASKTDSDGYTFRAVAYFTYKQADALIAEKRRREAEEAKADG
jgi:hypothetical protein